MWYIRFLKNVRKKRGCTEDPLADQRKLDEIADSFVNASFTDGYDERIGVYLKHKHKKNFDEAEVLNILKSKSFQNAFYDLDRYDRSLKCELDDVKEKRTDCEQGDKEDPLTDNPFFYVRCMGRSVKAYRGKSFYEITVSENLLGAHYGAMRKVGFVLHFIANYAWWYKSAMQIVYEYSSLLKGENSKKFMHEFLTEEELRGSSYV